MVITTTLPEDFRESTLAIRSSLQDISFYINGELRTKYDTSGHRIFGKNSSSRYVFCATSPEDAGKELRIEIKTHTGKYSGVVNAVYCGDKFEIWEYIFSCYGFETILAFFILFTGIFMIIFSIALEIVYQTKFDMEYLQLLSSVLMKQYYLPKILSQLQHRLTLHRQNCFLPIYQRLYVLRFHFLHKYKPDGLSRLPHTLQGVLPAGSLMDVRLPSRS